MSQSLAPRGASPFMTARSAGTGSLSVLKAQSRNLHAKVSTGIGDIEVANVRCAIGLRCRGALFFSRYYVYSLPSSRFKEGYSMDVNALVAPAEGCYELHFSHKVFKGKKREYRLVIPGTRELKKGQSVRLSLPEIPDLFLPGEKFSIEAGEVRLTVTTDNRTCYLYQKF